MNLNISSKNDIIYFIIENSKTVHSDLFQSRIKSRSRKTGKPYNLESNVGQNVEC